MPDFKAVSPLLDGFTVGECISSHDGIECYRLRHNASGQRFILKHISIPESEAKLQALLLSGAYASAEDANVYFKLVADNYVNEFNLNRSFVDCPYILHYLAHQTVAKQDGPGYDVYAVTDESVSLRSYLQNNAMTKLHAVNLGIDLCAALCAIRSAGYLHQNIKPENIFVEKGRFLLGDLGLTAVQDMKYSSLPEQYIGPYTAPELQDIMAEQNTTTDLYAVGMLLYRVYNADHAPFEDEKISAKEADRMRLTGKELPAPMYADYELAEILLKACAFQPEDRYQSPAEMKQALELYMQRNAIADTLIVPPIIRDEEPLLSEAMPEEESEAPVRFADVDGMDDDFIRHFTPDKDNLDATIRQLKKEDAKEAAKAAAQKEKEADEEVIPEAPAPKQDTAPEQVAAPEPAQEALPSEEQPQTKLPENSEDLPAQIAADSINGFSLVEEAYEGAADSTKYTDEKPKKKNKKKSKHLARYIVLAGVVLLLAAAAFIYFFTPIGQRIYHYTISIEQLDILSVTADSVRVRVRTNVEQPPLTLSCKDSYGNRFEAQPDEDGISEFTDLASGTQYTITAALTEDAGLHRLSGITSASATTLPSTEILSMTATAGSEEGAVLLNLVVKDGDPEPASWTVSYSCDGEESGERTFPGTDRSFTVSGLSVEKEYTFTLVSSDLFKLIGETSVSYTTEKEVTAEGLVMASFTDGVLRVRWDCTSDAPEVWTVTCTDAEANAVSVETEQCEAAFEGCTVGKAYTVTLQARGLFIPLTVEIPETLVHIDAISAIEQEDGVHVAWTGTAPDGGWVLLCTAAGDDESAAHNADTNEVVLTDLLPDTSYTFEVKCAGAYTAVGHSTMEYAVAKPADFDSRGMTAANTQLATYAIPEKEDWQHKDLETAKTEFTAGEKLAYKLTSRTGRYKGSFSLLYVIRDENKVPVDYGTAQYVWNEVWSWDNGSNFGMAGTVTAPSENGTYTIELYFSYDLEGCIHYQYVATSAPFTVTGAAE